MMKQRQLQKTTKIWGLKMVVLLYLYTMDIIKLNNRLSYNSEYQLIQIDVSLVGLIHPAVSIVGCMQPLFCYTNWNGETRPLSVDTVTLLKRSRVESSSHNLEIKNGSSTVFNTTSLHIISYPEDIGLTGTLRTVWRCRRIGGKGNEGVYIV